MTAFAAATEFAVPRQNADRALVEFARQAGVSVLFPSTRIGRIQTNPLHGPHEIQDALAILLRDTGLSAELDDAGVLTIKVDNTDRGNEVQEGKRKSWFAAVLSSFIAALTAGNRPAAAQTADAAAGAALEEIVVTAERRTSDIQKTAASVAVRAGEDLLMQGKYTNKEILEDVVGVAAGDFEALGLASDKRGQQITIRGVPTTGTVPTTAVYTDGIYEGIGSAIDIERVEVLRGPQGTLYGRSATSGVVAFHTRNPSFEALSADVSAELGNYSLQRYTLGVNLPMSDTLAVRVSANRYQRDGYYHEKANSRENTAGRVKLLYQPLDDLSILFGFVFDETETSTGGVIGTLTAPGVVAYAPAPVLGGSNSGRQYWVELNWDLGPVTLTYQPAFRTFEQNTPAIDVGPGGVPLVNTETTPFDQFHTEELRLASNTGGRLIWQAGIVYFDNRFRQNTNYSWYQSHGLLENDAVEKQTTNWGVFGELTYGFTEATRLTVGGRYDYSYVSTQGTYTFNANRLCNVGLPFPLCPSASPGPPVPPDVEQAGLPEVNTIVSVGGSTGTRRFYNSNYKLRVEHDLTPRNLVYAMMSSGFLPGDVQITNAPAVVPYASETLTAYEIGGKNRFLDNSLQLNASAYYYRYGGFQTNYNPNPLDPSSAQQVTVPARMLGGEVELLYQFTSSDRFGLNYSYTDAYYVDKPAEIQASIPQSHLAIAPHRASANYEHTFHLPGASMLVARADANFVSAHRLANLTQSLVEQGGEAYVQQDDELIANLGLTWNAADGRYSVSGSVRNVTDEVYVSRVFVQSISNIYGDLSEPRTYGVTLSARF